ncbi:MAG: GNAT family N-acetyltransferase [Rhodocyclaceae bacterium]|nr:GNAT family N-acetyltransferase [Rhodocyclaceae bacterium]
MPDSTIGLTFFVKPFQQLDACERDAWAALVDRYPDNRRAFMTPVYAEAVAAGDPSVCVLVVHANGTAAGFMPLQRRVDWAGRLGVYEPVGGVMTDYFGLVAAPDLQIDIKQALRECRLPLLAFTHLDTAQLQHGLPAEQARIGLKTEIEEPVADFWERLRERDKKFVYDTERRERKLGKDYGELCFESDSSSPQEDLATLIALKCAQYTRSSKLQAPLFARRNVELLHRLLDARSPQCTGVLSTLKLDGRIIAAHFGLRCHETLHYWFPVYDPAFSNYAPGRILFRRVLEASVPQGVRIIDRGEGDTQAKRDFANREHLFYRGLWSAGGISALPGRAVLSLLWRLA